jgi:hypothetical protein
MTMPGEPFEAGFAAPRDQEPGMNESLLNSSARWNAQAQSSIGRPQSVLNQIGLSPVAQNASAPSMADRFNSFTGTVMPNTNNAGSAETAETALKLRLRGDNSE